MDFKEQLSRSLNTAEKNRLKAQEAAETAWEEITIRHKHRMQALKALLPYRDQIMLLKGCINLDATPLLLQALASYVLADLESAKEKGEISDTSIAKRVGDTDDGGLRMVEYEASNKIVEGGDNAQ